MQVVPGRRRDLQVTRQSSLHEVTPPQAKSEGPSSHRTSGSWRIRPSFLNRNLPE